MTYTFKPTGCCAKMIQVTTNQDRIAEVKFTGGCRGNTMGIERLIRERSIAEAAKMLRGIICRSNTSCPDQLALALEEIMAQQSAA